MTRHLTPHGLIVMIVYTQEIKKWEGVDVMAENEWIKLNKNFMESDWYKDSKMVHVFLHLVMSAIDHDIKWLGIPVHKGQVLTSRLQLVDETGLADTTIRQSLDKLVDENMIKMTKFRNYTLITICNYKEYCCSHTLVPDALNPGGSGAGPRMK